MNRPNTVAKAVLAAGVGIALVAVAVIAGCGGGGAGGAVGTVQVAVAWPKTSAAGAVTPASIPTDTQSITVEARQNNLVVASCVLNRPATQGALANVPAGPTVIKARRVQPA